MTGLFMLAFSFALNTDTQKPHTLAFSFALNTDTQKPHTHVFTSHMVVIVHHNVVDAPGSVLPGTNATLEDPF
jgi:hypothetical protein